MGYLTQAILDQPRVDLVGEWYLDQHLVVRQNSLVAGPATISGPGSLSWDHRGIPMATSSVTLRDITLRVPAFLAVQNPTLDHCNAYEAKVTVEDAAYLQMHGGQFDHANNTSLEINGRSWAIVGTTFRNRQEGKQTFGSPVKITGQSTGGRMSAVAVAGAGPLWYHRITDVYYPAPGWMSIQLDGPHNFSVGQAVVISGCGPANGEYVALASNYAAGVLQLRTKPGCDNLPLHGGLIQPPIAGIGIHSGRGPVNECTWDALVIEGLTADTYGVPYPDKVEGSCGVLLYGTAHDIYRHTFTGCHFDGGWDNVRAMYAHGIEMEGCTTSAPDVGFNYDRCYDMGITGHIHFGQRTWPSTGALINPNFDTVAAVLRETNGVPTDVTGITSSLPIRRA